MEKNTSRCLTQKAPYKGLAAMSAKGQKRSKPKFKHCNHVAISYDARAMDHRNHNHEDVPRERL
jgi:hypothetical protein